MAEWLVWVGPDGFLPLPLKVFQDAHAIFEADHLEQVLGHLVQALPRSHDLVLLHTGEGACQLPAIQVFGSEYDTQQYLERGMATSKDRSVCSNCRCSASR